MATKVAVVTGGNRGIGVAIVRGLCKRFGGVVYLTSRDVAKGKETVEELKKEGLDPHYHQLDINDAKSIEVLRDYLKEKYGGFDLLINNAAIAFKYKAVEPVAVQAEQTIGVNYFSVLKTCEILFPILRNGGRVVNLSSSAGHLTKLPSKALRARFYNPDLTLPELNNLMNEYVEAAKKGTQVEDWGTSSYVVSKVGVTALTRIQQKLLNDRDIKVNCVHPGYVDTEMTSHKGPWTVEQGADAPLYLALDAPDSVRGQYVWCDRNILDWNGEYPNVPY